MSVARKVHVGCVSPLSSSALRTYSPMHMFTRILGERRPSINKISFCNLCMTMNHVGGLCCSADI